MKITKTGTRSILAAMAGILLSSAAVSAPSPDNPPKGHLAHGALMALAPNPNVRPKKDANGYLSGGIGVLVYDGVNAMDVMGPFQVFSSAGLQPMLISAQKDAATGEYKTTIKASNGVSLSAARTIANTPNLDVLVLAGGVTETIFLAQDPVVINWIKSVDKNTVWTSSVCTGSWILGAAGLLKDKKATSNWYRADQTLKHFGAIPQPSKRYVQDGKIWTSAGVTAGMDMALAMVKQLYKSDMTDGKDFTQAVMLDLQYDPKPPIRGGSKAKTHPYVFAGMEWMYDYFKVIDYVEMIPVQ
jgi:transcriptional regulator GlxA family with amidase domain